MTTCGLSAFPVYTGDPVCTGATEQEQMARYCAWNTYFKDVFTPAVGTLATELKTCTDWIVTKAQEIENNATKVLNASTTVSSVMGSTYGGEWNANDDFVNKTVIYNGAIWVGLKSAVGETPTFNNKWIFVNHVTKIVYTSVDYISTPGDIIQIDTTNNEVSVTLPANPFEGQFVEFIDIKSMFNTHKLIVLRNGHNIMGLGEDMEVNKQHVSFRLEFLDNNWRIK